MNADREQPQAPPRERRANPRHPVDGIASIRLIDLACNLPGRIVDVSLGGCRIRTRDRFPVGIYRRAEVEFTVDGIPFRLPAVIQSVHDRHQVGIRFIGLSERKLEQLSAIIAEIAAAAKNPSPADHPTDAVPRLARED